MNIIKKIKKVLKSSFVFIVVSFFVFGIIPSPKVQAMAVGDGVFIYDQTTPTTNVQKRTWDEVTATVGAASSPFAGSGTSKHIYAKGSQTRKEILLGIQDSAGLLTIYKSTDDGATWASQWTATVGDGNLKRFEITYEQTSGDALVIYSGNVATDGQELKYYTYNGTTWVGPTNLGSARTTGTVYGIRATERSGSNEIGIVWVDTNNHMSTNLWTGTAWYGEPTDKLISGTYLTIARSGGATPSAVPTRRGYDIAFESLSGDLMVVWGNDSLSTTQVDPKYIIKTAGGAWGAAAGTAIANLTEDGEMIDIAASPISDKIALSTCSVDTGADCNSIVWSGTVWGTVVSDTASAAAIVGESSNNVEWLVDGANEVSVITYSDAAGGGIDWYTSVNGATPVLQTDNTLAPVITGLERSGYAKVNPADSREAIFMFEDANADIFVKRAYLTTTTVAWSNPTGLSTAIEAAASVTGFNPIGFAFVRFVITTTLGDGNDGGNSTIAPGASATEIDRFSLVAGSGTDTVTGMTVTLGPANAFNYIATVDVQTTGGVSKCSLTPTSNTVLLTSCAISVTTTPTEYVIKITPKTHANMPAVPGAEYAITATASAIIATNTIVGTDTNSATITVDNLSPGDAGNFSIITGDTISNTVDAIAIDSTYMYVAGYDDNSDWRIEKRLLSTSAVDSNFGTSGVITGDTISDTANDIAIDSTYMYVAGDSLISADIWDWRIEKRLLSSGAVDLLFGTSGVITGDTASDTAYAIAIDSTYMYVAGGDVNGKWRIEKRLLTTGAVVSGFGTSGVITGDTTSAVAYDIAIDSTYMYVAGYDSLTNWRIEKRLLSTGAVVSGFGTSGVITGDTVSAKAKAIAIDGTYMYVAGYDDTYHFRIEKRLLTTGAVVSGFGTSGVITGDTVSDVAYDIAIDSTYMYVAGDDDNMDWRIEKRLLSDGTLVSGFGTSGVITGDITSYYANAIAIDATYMYVGGRDDSANWRIEKRLLTTGAVGGGTLPTATAGDTVVNLAWSNPSDSDFTTGGTVVVLRRATSAVADVPVEGTTYSVGNIIGTATVACVVTGSPPATTCQDTGLDNGTPYYYKIFTQDSRGNYDAGTVPPAAVTTLGDGTDGGNSTIAPGAGATEIDRFSLVNNSADTVTGMTVTLGPANAFNNIATVDVQTTEGVSKCSATPSSNTVLLTGCAILVTTTSTDYKIMITPKTHANMPAVPGAEYATTATVTAITANNTNTTTGTDTNSATITVDNLSPGSSVFSGVFTGDAASKEAFAIAIDATYMYVAGYNSLTNWRIEKRLLTTGELDTGFGTSGVITGDTTSRQAKAIAIDSTSMYVAGYDSLNNLRIEKRLLSDGTLVSGFGTSGVITGDTTSKPAYAIAIDSTYMYVGGSNSLAHLRIEKRLLSDGTLVSGFGDSGSGVIAGDATSRQAYDIAIDSTYMYVAGYNSLTNWRIEKLLLSDGTLVSGFGNSGVIAGDTTSRQAFAIAIDSTSMYVAGSNYFNYIINWRIERRLLSTGELGVTLPTATAGDTVVNLAWSNPSDSDFTTGGTVVVLRRATSAVADVPVEGTTYSVGNIIGTATVACVVTGSPRSITLAVGSSAPVGGVMNVAIPAAGGTDTTGVITGYVATSADKIKFTVVDGGSATSTITINGGAYTSGADYQVVPTTSLLSVVVTTAETGKPSAVRTFTIAGPIVGPDTLTYGVVLGPDGKQRWLDRNLGATRVATSATDYQAYGSLFQWGRGADGHQLINHTSATTATAVNGSTSTPATSDTPGDNLFIKNTNDPFDWRNPQNNSLWQGVNGVNNVCPAGFRIPTTSDLSALTSVTSARITNLATAYSSSLKLTASGYRAPNDASPYDLGFSGNYWSSTSVVSGTSYYSYLFSIYATTAAYNNYGYRGDGAAVRCIANFTATTAVAVPPATTCQDTGLDNGTPYYYKIFTQDSRGNYDAGTVTGSPATPVGAGITISGTCDAFDQTTDCGDTGEIKVAVNGVLNTVQTQPTVAGTWSIANFPTPANGASIIVFIDGAVNADRAVAITKYDGSGNIDNIRLYKEHLTIGTDGGSNSGQTIAITDLDDYDTTNDADVFYDVLSSGTCEGVGSFTGLCVDGSNTSATEELLILAGNTFAPAGNVRTHNVEIVGTWTGGAHAYTITGSWMDTGTFTPSTSTTTFTSTTSETITTTGSTFGNLTFNGSGGAWATMDAMTVNNDLTITQGTLTVGANNITVSGTTSITGGLTLSSVTGTKTFTGNVTINASGAWNNSGNVAVGLAGNLTNNQTFTAGSGVYTMSGTSKTISGTISIPSLTISGTTQNNGTLTVATLLAGASTLTNGATGILNIGQATVPLSGGTLTATASGNIVNYTAVAPNCKVTTYNILNFTGSGAVTCAVTSVTGNLGTSGTVTWTTGANLTVGGILTVGNGTTLTQGAFTLAVTGNTTIGGGTSGAFVGSGGALTLNGNLILSSGSTWTKGAGTVTFSKGAAQTLTGNAINSDLGIIKISANTGNTDLRLGSSVKVTSITIDASQIFTIGANTLTLTGSTPFGLTATGTASVGSTIAYIPSQVSGIVNLPGNLSYYNVVFNKASNSFVPEAGTINVTNDLDITAGTLELNTNDPTFTVTGNITNTGILSAPSANSLTFRGNLTNNGTFTHNTGLVIADPSGNTTTINGSAATTNFNSFTMNQLDKILKFKAGNTYGFAGVLTLSGNSGNPMDLESDLGSSQWLINFTGTSSISHVRVKDSGCGGGTSSVFLQESVSDLGNNNASCWKFVGKGPGPGSSQGGSGSSGAVSGVSGGFGGSGGSEQGSGGVGAVGGAVGGGGGEPSP